MKIKSGVMPPANVWRIRKDLTSFEYQGYYEYLLGAKVEILSRSRVFDSCRVKFLEGPKKGETYNMKSNELEQVHE